MSPWSRFSIPIYKNTGSVARDHLASERTFLAWIRTGLGFVALGIAVERFSQLDLTELLRPPQGFPAPQPPAETTAAAAAAEAVTILEQHRARWQADEQARRQGRAQDKLHSQMLVGVLMALGSGSILYGTRRYFTNLRSLEQGLFRPAFHGAAVMGAAVAGLAGGVFGSAVARRKSEEEGV